MEESNYKPENTNVPNLFIHNNIYMMTLLILLMQLIKIDLHHWLIYLYPSNF